MSEVLFEVTTDNLETGMRGYPVGYCMTSTVDPMKGLYYVGKPVTELANWQPEEVVYLLYFGKVGTAEQVRQFAKDLQKRAKVSPAVIQHICQLPRKGHPMELFCAALFICGMLEGTHDYREDCLNLIAKV